MECYIFQTERYDAFEKCSTETIQSRQRLQIILVAKNIYIYVSQLFISRMMQLIHEGLLHKTENKNNEPTLTMQQVNRVVLT